MGKIAETNRANYGDIYNILITRLRLLFPYDTMTTAFTAVRVFTGPIIR